VVVCEISIVPQPKPIPLTIVDDINGSTRSENREYTGFIKAGGVSGAVLDLEAETENLSTHAGQVTGRVIYLGAVKRRTRASCIGDVEAVLGELV
jgi:hypothetical protein